MTSGWQSKERQYRSVEALRQRNLREERLLHRKINMPKGMQDTCRYHIAAMSKEQRRVRRELAHIRATLPNVRTLLPLSRSELETRTRQVPENIGRRSLGSHEYSLVEKSPEVAALMSKRNMRDQNKLTEDRLQRFRESYPLNESPTTSIRSTGETNDATLPAASAEADGCAMLNQLSEAKANVQKRLVRQASNRTSTYLQDVLRDDTYQTRHNEYSHRNADGRPSSKTTHALPDFMESFSEAKKARYIRHKEKQWHEKELTIKAIFDPNRNNLDVA